MEESGFSLRVLNYPAYEDPYPPETITSCISPRSSFIGHHRPTRRGTPDGSGNYSSAHGLIAALYSHVGREGRAIHLNTSYLKTRLIDILGEKPTAVIQAVHFVHLLRTKRHHTPEADLLPELLHDGETAIDIGANGADWTYWLERCIGKTGQVYAFEADPYYALATKYAIKLLRLKRTRLFSYGLSDSDEEVPLRLVDSEGLRTFGISHIEKQAVRGEKEVQMVRLKRLDSMTGEYPLLLNAALIKCDVEGYELYVFRGASDILECSRPFVILEVGHCAEQGYSQEDLFEFFHDRRYASFAMTGDHTLAPTDGGMRQEKALSINRVLLPVEKMSQVREKIRILN